MRTKVIIAFIFILFIVIFSLQNTALTEVDFLVWKFSMSRVLIILGSFGIGMLAGILISIRPKKSVKNKPEETVH